MNENANLQNVPDPTQTLQKAQERLDALVAEAETIGARRREIHEQETQNRMRTAIEGGDVAGTASAALGDLRDLDAREDALPAEMWGARLAVMYAEAAVERQEQQRYEAMEPEARAQLRPAREALEKAEAEVARVESRYNGIERGIICHEERALTLEGEAGDLFEAGPSTAPLGGQVSPMEGGGTSLRNLRRPR